MTLSKAQIAHGLLLLYFGGKDGVRDFGLLDSAIQRAKASFDQQDLYPSPTAKAAATLESIVRNHPFFDGNKRTGYVMMRLTLLHYGLDIKASQGEKYAFVIQIAEGKLDFDEIKEWLDQHSYSRDSI